MTVVTTIVVAVLTASLTTASLLTALHLPVALLPVVMAAIGLAVALVCRRLLPDVTTAELTPQELFVLALALVVGLLRLTPYGYQYVSTGLVAAVTFDDNWHFQELASLVNSDAFPPNVNFRPDSNLHFYYLAWMPAAALSVLSLGVFGQPLIKLTYGLGAMLIDLAAVWCLIAFIRHVLPDRARNWALGAVLIAGAAADAPFALLNILASGAPAHAEWWQTAFGIKTQFSSLTTALIWVPHHLIAGFSLLLAVVIVTEPGTLAPRRDPAAFAIAGLLVGFSAFASIFALVGGVVALSPLLLDLGRREHLRNLAVLGLAALAPSLPLAYLYLEANASGGFVIGQPFTAWSAGGGSGSLAAGLAGALIAGLLMLAEVGWLYVTARLIDRQPLAGHRLALMATTAFVFLLSTIVIGFSGSNNWAMRGAIVPTVLVGCYWAGVITRDVPASSASGPALSARRTLQIATAALGLAAIAQLNEVALLTARSIAAQAFASETVQCKSVIREINDRHVDHGDDRGGWAGLQLAQGNCRDRLSAYHMERRFIKPQLSAEDRELLGRKP